jgi:FKBP12-rapamycin complex-associated protein
VNQQHLKEAWNISQMQTREDWREWFESLSMELIKESPSPAIRACVSLVDSYKPLGLDLFNAAFVSCWTELFEGYKVSTPYKADFRLAECPVG